MGVQALEQKNEQKLCARLSQESEEEPNVTGANALPVSRGREALSSNGEAPAQMRSWGDMHLNQ